MKPKGFLRARAERRQQRAKKKVIRHLERALMILELLLAVRGIDSGPMWVGTEDPERIEEVVEILQSKTVLLLGSLDGNRS